MKLVAAIVVTLSHFDLILVLSIQSSADQSSKSTSYSVWLCYRYSLISDNTYS